MPNPTLDSSLNWCIAVNIISGSIGLILGSILLHRTITRAPFTIVITMIALLMIASIFLLEYGIETYFYATNSRTTNKLPMAHLTNYIVSQMGGFLSLLCDLLMAAKYLDTGIRLYTQRFEKIITYSYGLFAAVISVIVLVTMTIVLSKLSSQDSLLAVYCN